MDSDHVMETIRIDLIKPGILMGYGIISKNCTNNLDKFCLNRKFNLCKSCLQRKLIFVLKASACYVEVYLRQLKFSHFLSCLYQLKHLQHLLMTTVNTNHSSANIGADIVESVEDNDLTRNQDVKLSTQQLVQNFTTWLCLPCLWH